MNNTHHHPGFNAAGRLALAGAAAVLLASGCASSARISGADPSTPAPDAPAATSTSSVPTTSDPIPSTTSPATTVTIAAPSTVAATTAPPTTAAPLPVTLRGDGIGSFDFGTPYAAVAAGLSASLEAETDEAAEFPVAAEYGFQTADGSRGFTSPFARLACWADGGSDHVCLAFGGADPTGLRFVGWYYTGTTLLSTSGVTGGSLWSEFPAMLQPGSAGCYTETSGSIDGIFLVLVSSGAPFSSYDDFGNIVASNPDPAGVSVRWMEAGDNPHDLEGDC
ncbi:MAG: hypothetical protein WCC60_04065 [Ilumatobacteraceae bacterium]